MLRLACFHSDVFRPRCEKCEKKNLRTLFLRKRKRLCDQVKRKENVADGAATVRWNKPRLQTLGNRQKLQWRRDAREEVDKNKKVKKSVNKTE